MYIFFVSVDSVAWSQFTFFAWTMNYNECTSAKHKPCIDIRSDNFERKVYFKKFRDLLNKLCDKNRRYAVEKLSNFIQLHRQRDQSFSTSFLLRSILLLSSFLYLYDVLFLFFYSFQLLFIFHFRYRFIDRSQMFFLVSHQRNLIIWIVIQFCAKEKTKKWRKCNPSTCRCTYQNQKQEPEDWVEWKYKNKT